jgi:glycosyltransferase involved in cell wall biosynthesis
MKTGDGFRFAANTPPTLVSTCIAILLHQRLGSLEDLSPQCAYVQSCQDPTTGRFVDPLLNQFPIAKVQDRACFKMQTTYFAIQALDALGAPVLHPLHFLAKFEAPGAMAAWLDQLDWSNPERETNRLMFLLTALIHRAEKERHASAPALYHQVLDWLDRAQDSRTKLSGTLIPFYEFVHRPICGLAKIVDAALSLEHPGGDASADLAAIDLLATFIKQFDYRAADIKEFLTRNIASIANLQNADGGFSFSAEDGKYRFGGWAPLEVDRRESNVWSTWLRLQALQIAGGDSPAKEKPLLWLRYPVERMLDPDGPPDVSVVISCYNLGRYLYEAVDSVLRQTLQAVEIILIDDGSTDEFTIRYLNNFHAPKTRVIRTGNQGLPAARNTGIESARGRYICCLDADDRLKPAFLEKAVRILDDSEDIGFVSCYYETFDGDHSIYRYDHCRFPELLVQNEAVEASVFRKDAWSKVGGYSTSLKAMEDWDFWIGLIEQGYRGEVIPEILFEYRIRIGSMYAMARRAENYTVFAGQIIERHQESYRTHYLDVLRLKTTQFAQLAAVRQQEIEESARANTWLKQQVRNWQQVAEQRQETLVAYEAGKAWLEDQLGNWQKIAEQNQATSAKYEADKSALEERVRSFQQVAAQNHAKLAALEVNKATLEDQIRSLHQTAAKLQENLTAYEEGKAWLEQQFRNWQTIAEERGRWIAELEKAKIWLAQQGGNWRAVAEQRSARIALLEDTITQMRATRAWRAAEGSVGLLRKLAGIYRSAFLIGSPRQAGSNAKNILLWAKLLFGDAAGRACWDANFDSDFYTVNYPDVAKSGISPRLHFLLCGYKENRNPSASFDSAYYCLRHADVREADVNPLLHYALFGRQEQRHSPQVQAKIKSVNRQPLVEARSETPLISVVIPCFNYGEYVEQAIQSVLSQTFTNIEIIVVEGGSTDGTTPGILRNLEQKHPSKTRFVYRTEAHLVGDNRNFGINLARGRYVCCLDADDLLKPVYLETAAFWTEMCGYDVVYPSVRSFAGDDFKWLLCDPTWPEITNGNQISTVAMFRKAAWERAGGFRDWGKGEQYVPEDWEFWVRLVGQGFRGKSIREPLMLYRVHNSGLWGTRGLPIEQQRRAIREANPKLFANGFVPPPATLDRPAAVWDSLIESADSRPTILFALPFIIHGGAEKVFATLARSLIERGYKVMIITTLTPAETIPDCTESFEAVTPYLYSFPRLFQNQEGHWKEFLFYLLRRHQVGMILIAGCDFVYRLLPEISGEFPTIAILDQLFNDEVHFHTNRRYAPYIDTTFVPSQMLADKLIAECGGDPDKVCVVPHGIDMEEMSVADAPFDSCGLPQHFRGKFLVSFFGRLSAEKAPADFVEIARILRSYEEICFLMTGEGQERTAVLALIERYGLRDRIHAPGFVDNIHALIALSDVVVVPSHLDGMPLVIFEAQAFGKPVVASAVGSIPHVIANGETGLLCAPGDVNGFAERILQLWRTPEMRRAIGDAASIWVRANHSAGSMTAKYIRVFDRLQSRVEKRPAALSIHV